MAKEDIDRTIAFEVPGIPRSKNRRSAVGGRQFVPSEVKQAQDTFASRSLCYRPRGAPHGGPIAVKYTFCFPIPKSWPKWRKELVGVPHASRPDAENLVKLCNDALTGIYWLDDSQIFMVLAKKIWSEVPKTQVEITFFSLPKRS
jgi:Holliday junction resolvase RusA-like endonuclease